MSTYTFNSFFNGTFVEAIFTKEDRSIISAVFLDDKGERFAYHIEADLNQPAYTVLLKFVTVEELEQWTRDQIADERSALLVLAFEEAAAQGYEISNDLETIILTKIFEFNPELNAEFLFKFKLKAFETEMVSNCSNEDLRIELRDATTPMEVIDVLARIKLEETTAP